MQGLIVGPTPKPGDCSRLRRTRFNRKDLPVRYFPTNEIIPMFFEVSLLSKVLASWGITNLLFSNITNGIGF